MYSYVSAVFKAAVRDRVLASTPCLGIDLPKQPPRRVVPLTVEQVAEIRSRLNPRYQAALTFATRTGMRPGEVFGLTIDRLAPRLHIASAIPPRSCVVTVDQQLVDSDADGAPVLADVKTPSSVRTLTIGETATRALVEHLRTFGVGPGGLVFTNTNGGPVLRKTQGETWRRAVRGMDVKPRSGWHECRHFHASLLIAQGLSPTAVAARLGHKDATETLSTYSHLWATDEQQMVDTIERALDGL
jgi:integrase